MDTKSSLAAFMTAVAAAEECGLRGDVILTAVVDEEYASVGTEAVVKRWKADAAMVGEPTGMQIVIAHKGFAWLEVETRGVAAHGSRPDKGVDAIAKMGRVLVALEDLGKTACRRPIAFHARNGHRARVAHQRRAGAILVSGPVSGRNRTQDDPGGKGRIRGKRAAGRAAPHGAAGPHIQGGCAVSFLPRAHGGLRERPCRAGPCEGFPGGDGSEPALQRNERMDGLIPPFGRRDTVSHPGADRGRPARGKRMGGPCQACSRSAKSPLS